MIKRKSQKINLRQTGVMDFRIKRLTPMWSIDSNQFVRSDNAKIHSKSSNIAKKIMKAVYMYCLMFLENSSIHGLNHLIAKKRASTERCVNQMFY